MQIRKELIVRQIGNKYMILDPVAEKVDMACVLTLNKTAALLLEKLSNRDFEAEEVIALLMAEYGIDEERAIKDAEAFVKMLKDTNMLI